MSAAVTVAQTEDSTSPGKNEPKDGALYQQRMKAWYPILHPVWVIGGLFVLGIVFIPVGKAIFMVNAVAVVVMIPLSTLLVFHSP